MNNGNKEKGNKAEALFAKFLDENEVPYYRIDQNMKSYSGEFSKHNIRRPDYTIHTCKGLFYIDVKYRARSISNNDNRFYLNQNDIESTFKFQTTLESPVWLSFVDDLESPKFYYSSISEIHDYYINILKILEDNYKLQKDCWIFIPENYLYDHLSFEEGFYKEPDINFFQNEAEYHKNKWENLTKRRAR
jgi:hypothetical protein